MCIRTGDSPLARYVRRRKTGDPFTLRLLSTVLLETVFYSTG